MADRAAELRGALSTFDATERAKDTAGSLPTAAHIKVLADAARTIALPILEGDEGLVERIARLLSTIQGTVDEYGPDEIAGWSKQILAALIEDSE